jgi:hypothetical protein
MVWNGEEIRVDERRRESDGRRRIVHVNVTACPTANWTAQQVVEAFAVHWMATRRWAAKSSRGPGLVCAVKRCWASDSEPSRQCRCSITFSAVMAVQFRWSAIPDPKLDPVG